MTAEPDELDAAPEPEWKPTPWDELTTEEERHAERLARAEHRDVPIFGKNRIRVRTR